jgi:hypothetical protein
MKKIEILSDKDILEICSRLEGTSKYLFVHSDLLEKFNFIHENVEYSQILPDTKHVYIIDKSAFNLDFSPTLDI